MKKIFMLTAALLLSGLVAISSAQVNVLNEPGSILVYPLIDNIGDVTIVNVANTGSQSVTLECFMVTHGSVNPDIDEKKDFIIKMSPKEKFWWNTAAPYNSMNPDGDLVQIQAFNERKGYMFCYAIDNDISQTEIGFNYLKGDATVANGANAFNYNAIPSQALAVVGDRVLNLDGVEYTMATSQVMVEGFAEVPGVINGTLAVANIGIDFILSEQPEFDINASCWNEDEVRFSRHLHYKDFEQYDFADDLQLSFDTIFTLGFQCATSSTNAIWAVFHQTLGAMGYGGNVWQHPATGVATTVVLPVVPFSAR